VPKPALRVYRYLTVPKTDLENLQIVSELVRCGKKSCRCALVCVVDSPRSVATLSAGGRS
jgi:hypothetical protein